MLRLLMLKRVYYYDYRLCSLSLSLPLSLSLFFLGGASVSLRFHIYTCPCLPDSSRDLLYLEPPS